MKGFIPRCERGYKINDHEYIRRWEEMQGKVKMKTVMYCDFDPKTSIPWDWLIENVFKSIPNWSKCG